MTKQALFDTVVAALRAQGRHSRQGDGICLYRCPLPDGTVLKCAAGHILPDALYTPDMERKTATGSCNGTVFESVVGVACLNLLGDLQRGHDIYEVADWEHGWKRIAELHRLVYTPPAA